MKRAMDCAFDCAVAEAGGLLAVEVKRVCRLSIGASVERQMLRSQKRSCDGPESMQKRPCRREDSLEEAFARGVAEGVASMTRDVLPEAIKLAEQEIEPATMELMRSCIGSLCEHFQRQNDWNLAASLHCAEASHPLLSRPWGLG
jgi:hypothetical protein